MIDLHLHVLPDLDDGASSLRESRVMLERLGSLGFNRIVSTPHLMERLTRDYHHRATAALDVVRPIAAEYGLSLDLGYEHLLVPDLVERLKIGEPSTLAGSSAVLVELPFIGWPRHADASLFDLQSAGYRPILAHPERYTDVQQNPEIALAAADRGIILQLTSSSFAGVYGKTAERTARTILSQGLERGAVFVLSTDAHSAGQRLAKVADGHAWIRKNIRQGSAVVDWAARATATAILQDIAPASFQSWSLQSAERVAIPQPAELPAVRREGGLRRILTRSKGL